jgi:hypothetical protein
MIFEEIDMSIIMLLAIHKHVTFILLSCTFKFASCQGPIVIVNPGPRFGRMQNQICTNYEI